MPSITLSDLSFATPDGRDLFSHLDLAFGRERTGLIGRNGTGKTTLLRLIAGELSPKAGTVHVDGTLAMLRQEARVAPDETVADLFGARDMLALIERATRGAALADELADADWTLEARMEAALARLDLSAKPETPLASLSGGERTRAGLAALVFAEPDILLLDEPTNNLDADGRRAVRALLAGWRGCALVVSHDRELLEEMDAIVELTSLGVSRYGGNWSHYRERKALELASAEHRRDEAEKRIDEARRTARLMEERKARRDRGGRSKAARGDMPRILAGGLKMRSEASGGSQARLAGRREADARQDLDDARARLEVLAPVKVSLPSSGLPAGRTVLALERVCAGYEPQTPVIRDLSMTIAGPERVAIAGPNGSGKSTLLSLIGGRLVPWSGDMRVTERRAMLDQHVDLLDPDLTIRDNFRRLNPDAGENGAAAALARFAFRADAALQPVRSLSGGQKLRAGLACVLGGAHPPELLILDEPTNHVDLDTLETIEAGLAFYDGALVVVSHDESFLSRIGIARTIRLGAGAG